MKMQKIMKKLCVMLAAVTAFCGANLATGLCVPEEVMAATSIPKEAKQYKNSDYMAYAEQVTWTEAKEKCEALGGHLATISSAEENQFVYELVQGVGAKNAWLGFYNAGTGSEQDWKWINGEKFSYTRWEEGEPNGAYYNNVRESYGGFLGDKWNDYTNDAPTPTAYVCEWDYSISVEESKVELLPGESITIDAVVKKAGKVVSNAKLGFKSTSTKVAKVSSKGKVIAVNAGSCKINVTSKGASKTVTVIVLPKKITSVSKASNTKNSVKIKWDEQKGVTGYEVWMYDPDLEEYTKVKAVSKDFTSATISDLKKGQTYKVKVRGYVKVGSKKYYGEFSNTFKAKTAK